MGAHRDDLALEKRLRVFRERREKVSDDRCVGRQGARNVEATRGCGQARTNATRVRLNRTAGRPTRAALGQTANPERGRTRTRRPTPNLTSCPAKRLLAHHRIFARQIRGDF